jgi:hypothetical protein
MTTDERHVEALKLTIEHYRGRIYPHITNPTADEVVDAAIIFLRFLDGKAKPKDAA